MRNLKRFYAVAIVLTMLVSMLVPATVFAAGSDYAADAKALYDLGLYKGLSPTEMQLDLDSTLNRQTAATMVLRLFGLEDEALQMPEAEAKSTLAKNFKDASSVDGWALKQVAYAVENDIIKGFPDGTFQPKGLLTGKQYNVLALKLLGYTDFTFEGAGKKFAEVAGLTAVDQTAFDVNGSIKKSILCGISRKALDAKAEGEKITLAQKLVNDGVIKLDVAKTVGLTVVAPTATAIPSNTPGSTSGVAYKGVTVTAATNPAVMAQTVNDFNFLNFKLTNGNAQDVVFSQFTVTMDRFLGTNTKVSDIKLWEGSTKKSPGTATWSGSTYTAVVNLTMPMTIKAGESKDLKVSADVASAVVGEQYKFTITDMQFGGSPTVGLPYNGNAVTVSTVSTQGTIQCTDETKTSAQENMSIGGRGIEVGKFKFTAPNDEKVTVSAVKISHTGTASSGKIESVDLYQGTTLVGTAGVDQTITFATPIVIEAAGNAVFTVKINTTTDLVAGNTFVPTISDVADVTATGDKFGASLKLDSAWTGASTYTAAAATITVRGIDKAQSTTVLQTAKDFKLGTIFVKNNNVEDIRLSTLKVNIVPSSALNGNGSDNGATSVRNIRLRAPNGNVLATSSDLNARVTNAAGATHVANSGVDHVVTFSLSNEYLIAKNTEVGFDVLVDVPADRTNVTSDAGKSLTLQFFENAKTSAEAHLFAVGNSSGTQLYAETSSGVSANSTTITASSSQKLGISKADFWDVATTGTPIAVGSSRKVVDWKIKDYSLNEDANVTQLKLTNVVSAASPQSFTMADFELYYDGVKVATAPTMGSDYTVSFGDSSNSVTLFTVKDGDTNGHSLQVKCRVDDAFTAGNTVDLCIGAAADLVAKGASTSTLIYGDSSVVANSALTNEKKIQKRYATFAKVTTGATSTVNSPSVELLRFTVTPQEGKSLNLTDMGITLYDNLTTITNSAVTISDVTNTRGVTLAAGSTVFSNGVASIAFNDSYYNDVTTPKTFSVRVNLSGRSGSYQISIKNDGDYLHVTAPTQATTVVDGFNGGFAPLGGSVIGDVITVTN